MKKILVISTSLRKGGNSKILVDEFARGAREAGNTVEKISLYNKSIGFCKGCLVCLKTQKCVIKDDAIEIAEKVKNADDDSAMDGAVKSMDGWISCFGKSRLAGVIRGTGVTDIGDVKNRTELLTEAYNMGNSTLTCFNN